jgi:hypothetical protein
MGEVSHPVRYSLDPTVIWLVGADARLLTDRPFGGGGSSPGYPRPVCQAEPSPLIRPGRARRIRISSARRSIAATRNSAAITPRMRRACWILPLSGSVMSMTKPTMKVSTTSMPTKRGEVAHRCSRWFELSDLSRLLRNSFVFPQGCGEMVGTCVADVRLAAEELRGRKRLPRATQANCTVQIDRRTERRNAAASHLGLASRWPTGSNRTSAR